MLTQSRHGAMLLFAMLAAWCGGQDRTPLIINGVPTDAFPAVGIVGELSVGGFCTGTLISPYHVLTAAHCGQAVLDFGSAQSGTFTVGGRTYITADVRIISSYNSDIFTDDVAVLVLSEPVEDVEPMLLSSIGPVPNDEVIVVGFGGQGTPEDGSDGSFGEKLVGVTTIDEVTTYEISWTFDELTESNPAPGDSGGPVILDTGETLLVVGIVSSGTTRNAAIGDKTYSMRVDAYAGFINEVLLTPVDLPDAPVDIPETPGDSPEIPVESDDEELGPVPPGDEIITDDPPPVDSEPGETESGETDVEVDAAENDVISCQKPQVPGIQGHKHGQGQVHGQGGHGQGGHGQGAHGHRVRGHGNRHGVRPSASQRAASRKHAQMGKIAPRTSNSQEYQSRKTSVRRLN